MQEQLQVNLKRAVDRIIGPVAQLCSDNAGIVTGIVIPEAQMTFTHMGFAFDPTRGKPLDQRSILRIGEATMPFTALAAQILVQQSANGFKWSDSIYDHLRDTFRTLSVRTPISLQDLATHTIGLADDERLYSQSTVKQFNTMFTRLIERARPPGNFCFSLIGPALLAQVIEVRAESSYKQLVLEGICRQLAMPDTVFELNAKQLPRLIQGYDENGALAFSNDCTTPLLGAKGLYSTTENLQRFLSVYLRQISAAELSVAAREVYKQTCSKNGQADQGMSLAWRIMTGGRIKWRWQTGSTNGSCCALVVSSEIGVGVVFLSNTVAVAKELLPAAIELATEIKRLNPD